MNASDWPSGDNARLRIEARAASCLAPQVRIIGTGLADERQPLGRLEENSGLENGDDALLMVGLDAQISRTLPKRLAKRKRKNDNMARLQDAFFL
jgi:hypothetical protein